MSDRPLAALLCSQLDAPPPADEEELELALQEVARRASEGCPVEVAAEELIAHLARRLPEGWSLDQLSRLHAADLALALAAARGEERAIAELDRHHFSVVDAALARMPDAAARAGEIKQGLRKRLLVAEEGREPRIALYSGRGALRGWLKVAAVRYALNELAKHRREVPLHDEMLADMPLDAESPELGHLKREYRGEFKRAFEEALASLEDRERSVLRYHYLRQLNIDQIGVVYKVHRTTVARWLARIREKLLRRTRRLLMGQLRVELVELDSIMRLIESQLDASIERILDSAPER